MSDESLSDQVSRLAAVIMDEIPGEPSEDGGAVDTAIRLLRAAYSRVRVIDLVDSVQDLSVNTESSVFPGATPPTVVESPDISDFIEPTIPHLRPGKQMSLVFVFNTEEELDQIVQSMRQIIKEDSKIEMIAALAEKTGEILALFQEEDTRDDGTRSSSEGA